jgi:hypothetical protein
LVKYFVAAFHSSETLQNLYQDSTHSFSHS